jgi:hypothetical protein
LVGTSLESGGRGASITLLDVSESGSSDLAVEAIEEDIAGYEMIVEDEERHA